MNKRDAMFSLLESDTTSPYVPAGFFLHFAPEYHTGQAAIDKHLEYFRYTGMDLVKIQYERTFPLIESIQQPADWKQMPRYGQDFYQAQLDVVGGLVKAAKSEAVVVITLYSPFMCAASTIGHDVLTEHLRTDPDAVKPGMEAITDSLLIFVRECIKLGVDGFYHSTQGGEAGRFSRETFENYIKPYDLTLMNEINERCPFNILHVCDYVSGYEDFAPFVDYPGHIVNCSLTLENGGSITMQQAADLFKRPYMGGLERKGVIATGTPGQIRQEVETLLPAAPDRFVLAADCTVPSETPWDNLKAAIDTAHAYQRA